MKKNFLNRRDFLRLGLVAAGGVVIAACQQKLQGLATQTITVGTSTASPTPIPLTKVSVTGGNLDAWTWTRPVKVGVTDPEVCKGVVVYVNGKEIDAKPENQTYTAEVHLSEGENQVSAACLPSTGEAIKSEPVIYTERLRQVPTAMIQVKLDNGQIVLDGSGSLSAEEGTAITDYSWSARENNPEPLMLENGELSGEVSGESISILSPKTDGEYYVRLRVKDQAGREDASTIYFVVENGQPRIPNYDTENPTWVENTIVYGIVPFLFGSPAFEAITEHLDDLADLGINAIWLAPVFVHPGDDYGYAVENYFELDPAYGTKEDFRKLVEAAHARGIKVLMDFVPNHTSDTHPYFQNAQANGKASPYWNFYDRDRKGNYTHYFDWTNLPNLNYNNPEVCRMMIEAFSYWVRKFDVDGFRVDAAWAIEERNPDFWPEWRRALKRIKPGLLLLAEGGARDPYFFDNGFDAAYDWTDQVGGWAWKVIWDTYKLRLLSYNLTYALTNRPKGFAPDALIFRFLNNNDTGKRFITRQGEGVTRVATALLLTLPGIPNIYTGDEYGLEFEPYQRLEPLVFKEQVPGLREYHKKLIALRKSMPSLHSRNMQIITPEAAPQAVYSYIRYGGPSDPPVLVLLNFSEEPTKFKLELPQEFCAFAGQSSLMDLLTEEDVPVSGGKELQIAVPAQTARLLVAKAAE